MGLYLYNDRDKDHKYYGEFNFIMREIRNINMMENLPMGTLPL